MLWLEGNAFIWLVAVVASPLTIVFASYLTTFEQRNWRLALGPEGFWINLRVDSRLRVPNTDTVFYLEYRDLIIARPFVAGPPSHVFLDLWLSTSGASRLKSVVGELPQHRRANRLLAKALGGPQQPTLSMPQEGLLRITWQSRWRSMRPGLTKTLEALAEHGIFVEDSSTTNATQLSDLTDDQVNAHVLRCFELGDRMSAIELLTQRFSYSAAEATQLVDQLTKPHASQRARRTSLPRRAQA